MSPDYAVTHKLSTSHSAFAAFSTYATLRNEPFAASLLAQYRFVRRKYLSNSGKDPLPTAELIVLTLTAPTVASVRACRKDAVFRKIIVPVAGRSSSSSIWSLERSRRFTL